MKRTLGIFALGIALYSCNSDSSKLQAELDRYKMEVEENEKQIKALTDKMGDINDWFDAIDDSRFDIASSIEDGEGPDVYDRKMRGIQEYLEKSRKHINDLEKALSTSESKKNAYSGIIKNLRASLEERELMIKQLQETLDKFKTDNTELKTLNEMQDLELKDKTRELAEATEEVNLKKEELKLLEKRLEELKLQSEKDKGKGLMAQGDSKVELAEKTKLAPKKKQQYYKEAYDLYKEAYSLGVTEAKQKMDQVEPLSRD